MGFQQNTSETLDQQVQPDKNLESMKGVTEFHKITRIAVVGAGLMGHGIAQVAAQFGKYEVNLCDVNQELLNNALGLIGESLSKFSRSGKITQKEMKIILKRIHPTFNLEEAIADTDLIIEAIDENKKSKMELLSAISCHANERTIIATNTSSIPITELASAVQKPENFCGFHFFNPPQLIELVEIIRGDLTSNETVQMVLEVAHKMERESVLVKKDCPGFIVNRILMPALNEAANLYFSGVAGREDIDKAIRVGLKWPMGPLMLIDQIGVDTVVAVSEILEKKFGSGFSPHSGLGNMVRVGDLGRKSGKGFYDWDAK